MISYTMHEILYNIIWNDFYAYYDLNHKHPIHYLNEIKEIIYNYQHKENVSSNKKFLKK